MIKIFDANVLSVQDICKRQNDNMESACNAASQIIARVIEGGDKALLELTKKFDGVQINALKVSEEQIMEAYNSADEFFISTLQIAKTNIETFHKAQLKTGFEILGNNGSIVGQKNLPIEKVGLYIPGGTANYPSTVLMNAIPAKIAGVKEIVIVTPPSKDGKVNSDVLVAAKIAGVSAIFKIGGAQAVAALAYGTETVPKVDKIVGPGNIYVAAAKKLVFGKVSIDMIAGPSEILIISDGKSDPRYLAADMLSQAEHDKNASAILITDSQSLAMQVSNELENQLASLERENIARASIDNNGKIIIVDNLDKAIEISNEIAPEHLELCVDNPFDMLQAITNAGSVFLGRNTPEAVGDYFAGTNHTLPTNGTAKFSSPLSVDDFIKKTQYVYYPENALIQDGERIDYFAKREGLTAHARSVTIRTGDKL
ncbi:MAG TPA: histidinol dehydrogenase [Clostridia bacterium]|nr:histidinol dehydrogenase [Clostridia bacterium]